MSRSLQIVSKNIICNEKKKTDLWEDQSYFGYTLKQGISWGHTSTLGVLDNYFKSIKIATYRRINKTQNLYQKMILEITTSLAKKYKKNEPSFCLNPDTVTFILSTKTMKYEPGPFKTFLLLMWTQLRLLMQT